MVFPTHPSATWRLHGCVILTKDGFTKQVGFLRCQFLHDGDLSFSNVLSEDLVKRALTAIGGFWMDRIFSPLVTLWIFLRQVLSADQRAQRCARQSMPIM